MSTLQELVEQWMLVTEKEKKNPNLRVKLLLGHAEQAAIELRAMLDGHKSSFYHTIDSMRDATNFHLGHYIVMCNSLLLFDVFKEFGAWSWSTPILPIHLALFLKDRAHWVPILAPLTGEKLQNFGVDGLNIVQWAIRSRCSLVPIIENNLWPKKQTMRGVLEMAKREKNETCMVVASALLDNCQSLQSLDNCQSLQSLELRYQCVD